MNQATLKSIKSEVRTHVLDSIKGRRFDLLFTDGVRVLDIPSRAARAGQWRSTSRTIEMNTKVCQTEEQYRSTLIHEWAHALCTARFPFRRIGHGREWKDMMRLLGANPSRCHDYDIAHLPGRTAIECSACHHVFQFSQRRINNVIIRGQTYNCKCDTPLVVSGQKAA